MRFPVVQIVAWLAVLTGAGALCWFETLDDWEKLRADGLAGEYAWQLYQKGLQELTRDELHMVQRLTRAHFG